MRPSGRAALLMLAAGLLPGTAPADVYVVDRADDAAAYTACTSAPGDCSLRGAVARAEGHAGADRIEFDAALIPPDGDIVVRLTVAGETDLTGDLDVSDDLTVFGWVNGRPVTISAEGLGDRVFEIAGATVTLQGVVLEGGSGAFSGGCLDLTAGAAVTLEEVTVRNCSAVVRGGAVDVEGGSLFVTGSTFHGNSAQVGSAVGVGGPVEITGSTISGNTGASTSGPPIYVTEYAISLTLSFVTVADNDQGSTDRVIDFRGDTLFTVTASLLDGGCLVKSGAVLTTVSGGGTVASPGTGCGLDALTDRSNVADLLLQPLGDYGGPTRTQLPLMGSPAVDDPLGVITVCPASDQRGLTRNVDGNEDTLVGCDAGAVERQPVESAVFVDGLETGSTSRWSSTVGA